LAQCELPYAAWQETRFRSKQARGIEGKENKSDDVEMRIPLMGTGELVVEREDEQWVLRVCFG